MWQTSLERDRPHMTIQRVRIAWFKSQATDTHSDCVIALAFPLLRWLQENTSMLRYTYIDSFISFSKLL